MRLPPSYGELQAALASKYDVERELGRGGMATVYLARDLRHDRNVAVGWSERAALAASAGRIADARDLLRRGIEARESYLSFESCPAWEPLRDDDEGRRMLDAAGP